jgi:hypothetical protein
VGYVVARAAIVISRLVILFYSLPRQSTAGLDTAASARQMGRVVGGAEEARTPDPLLAKEVLSQLSYGPSFRDEWWGILDSNQRPQSYQDCALTS